MKLFLLLWLFCGFAYAGGTQITASGGSPIPIAYSISNSQSKVRECLGNVVEVLNQSTSVLAIGFGRTDSVPGSDYTFIPPGPNSGSTIKPSSGLGGGTYIYIRAGTTAITSGTVQVSCYYED